MSMKDIYLASSSPRREQILKDLGLNFTVSPPVDFKEKLNGAEPEVLVCNNALGKAMEVAGNHKDSVIIGCDTIVVFDNEIFGKPLTPDNAYMMLKKLSGNSHSVFSGLAVIDTQIYKELVGYERAEVKFKELSEKEIYDYVESGEPLDKAGACGIQECGGAFVEEVKGNVSTVVGLPEELLKKFLSIVNLKS
ncbi:MAG: dTTP/UTP pyrophosphatase [Candidatus Scalindua arabica]|uniref:dTTP/UTP pyrophosphatase n=1 Tax=Candidatus Scalindua arabica TaxID=1127984 RepID=A0A942A2A9_9BACT|nr:dTTP/UTP pyrophosphatase [Candidatus Scalindua arabica]